MTYICGQRCEDCARFLGGCSLKVAVEVSRFPPLGIRGPWGCMVGEGEDTMYSIGYRSVWRQLFTCSLRSQWMLRQGISVFQSISAPQNVIDKLEGALMWDWSAEKWLSVFFYGLLIMRYRQSTGVIVSLIGSAVEVALSRLRFHVYSKPKRKSMHY